jgi:hypothetical protein
VNLGSNNINANSFIKVGGTSSQFLKADGSVDASQYVPTTRSINAGTGLTGGGNLSSDVTIAFDTTWGDIRYAYRTREIIAGLGLLGGGDLSANRTLNFDTIWGDARYLAPLSGYVPTSRQITINGTTFDLSANRSYSVGTVTSVGLTVPTGFDVLNTPIISSGDIVLSFDPDYSLPTNASQLDWNTAYNNRITSITTIGTSGAATLVSHVLNIPQYQAQGNYITSLTGEATASGPGAASVTLTNSAVTGKVLTGLTVAGSSVVATDSILTAFGKLQGQVNDLIGGLRYEGTWNAATNTPTITSGVGNDGDFYIVSVAGNTTIDGINDWQIGDWIVFHDTAWQKVDNTESVVSVNGLTGAVTLTTSNITEGTNLYFTDSRSRTSISLTTTGNSGAATYNNGTGIFNIPQYTLSGLGGVPTSRQITINGVTYDLSSDRSWTVGDVRTDSSYANPSWITSLAWSKITGTPTTLSGYGITDAYTQSQVDSLLSGYVTLATDQTITGLKTIVRSGDVLRFKIGTDTLYGLKLFYSQNELVPSGEATWSFVNTFNRNGVGYETTPISFFRGVLVTGERLLTASINANLLDYYGNNPSGRYPIYTYNTGIQQFSDGILVGFTTGVVNAVTGAISNLPSGVVANFNGRVIGGNAVNSNEFVTLSQLGSYVPTSRTLTINGVTFDLSANRSWTITSGVSSVTASSPLFSSGGSTPNITIQQATASQNGFLSSSDWTTFNNKANANGSNASGTWGINITGNAETVDGFSASQSNVANNIVVRDSSGYIFGSYINMTDDGNPGSGTTITSFITKQGDNYYRSVSPTNAMSSIRGVASGSWGINITGNSGNTSSVSNATSGNYTWTGTNYFRSNLGGYLGSLSNPPLQAFSDSNNSAFMSFHKSGNYAVNMGLDADNIMRIGGWSAAANRWELDMSGNNWVASSFRAPIFYDSNNTGFYLDPNSQSNIAALTVNNTLIVAASNAQFWQSANGAYQRVDARNEGTAARNHWYGVLSDGSTSNFRHSWYDGSAYFDIAATGGFINFTRSGGGSITTDGSFRAPIFFDSNNTNYYIDPSSTTSLRTVGSWRADSSSWDGEFNGKIQYHSNNWYFQAAGDWLFRNSGGTNVVSINQSGVITGSLNGNSSTATTLSSGRTNWVGTGVINNVVGMLSWKNYGNNHTIFDASQGTSPSGSGVNQTNSDVSWTTTYPTLMGWNGSSTYGVRVDSARNSDLVGGFSADAFYRNLGFGSGFPSWDLNTVPENRSGFTYSNNAPFTGPFIHIGASGYGLQFNAPYGGGTGLAFRTKNGDNGTWNAYRYPAVYGVNANGGGDLYATIYYDQSDTGYYLNPNGSSYLYSLILSGNSYFRPQNWIQFDGSYGLYWPNSYGAHLHANDLSTYTQFVLRGSKNSYGGIYDLYSAVNGIMYDSAGNGGVYREANGRWYFYYHLANDCMGIGTSNTSANYSLYLNKGVYAQSRIDATIFYDTNNTAYYCDPNSTSVLHTLINNVGWLEVRSNVASTNPTTESGLFFGWNKSGGNGEANIIVDGGANTGQFLFQRYNGGGSYTNIFQADIFGLTANSGTVSVFSDIRLKTNITNASPKLNDLMKLNVVNYEFVGEYNVLGKQLGFIAQEVEQIFPSLVREQDTRQYDDQGNYINGYQDTKILKVGMEFAMLVKAMQEQQSIINSLKSEIETLKQK